MSTQFFDAATAAQQLLAGDLELWQLPLPFQQLYFLGYNNGQAALKPRLTQAEHEAALAYERLYNPGKKFTQLVNRRLLQAAEAAMSEPDAAKYYQRVLTAACGRGDAA